MVTAGGLNTSDLLTLAVALPFIAWVVYDIAALKGEPSERALWLALAGVGASEFVHVHVIYDAIERGLGPGWGTVIFHVCNFAIALAALDLLHQLRGRSRRRRLISLIASLTVLLLAVLPWIIAPPTHQPSVMSDPLQFMNGSWTSITHWALILGYLAFVTASVSVIGWIRIATEDLSGDVRMGLHLISASGAVMTVVFVMIGAEQALWFTPWRSTISQLDVPLHSLGSGLGLLLLGLGAVWSKLVAQLRRLRASATIAARNRHLRRHAQELHPLTTRILAVTGSPWPLRWRLRTQLEHEVILVNGLFDAHRALSRYIGDCDRARMADHLDDLLVDSSTVQALSPPSREAVLHQAELQLASHRRSQGAQPVHEPRGTTCEAATVRQAALVLDARLHEAHAHGDVVEALLCACATSLSQAMFPTRKVLP